MKLQEYIQVKGALRTKKYKEINDKDILKAKAKKYISLDNLTATANTIVYDANGKALGNMASVVSLSNWAFNKAISSGISNEVAYTTIYKDSTIKWRGADNIIHVVQIESICEALHASMLEVAKALGV